MITAPKTRASLIQRVAENDRHAWGVMFDLYGPLVFSCSLRYGLNQADALDLVQDLMMALPKLIRKYVKPEAPASKPRSEGQVPEPRFRNWLWKVTARRVMDFHGRKRQDADPALLDVLARLAQQPEPDAQWNADHNKRVLELASERVRPKVRELDWLLFWRNLEGESVEDAMVALKYDNSMATAYRRVEEVKKMLRDEITLLEEDDS